VLDRQAWADAYDLEYLGFVERGVLKVVETEPGVRIHDTITRLEYKEDICDFLKVKALISHAYTRASANSLVSFKETGLYAQGGISETAIGNSSSAWL
jgi:hypothetical protein